MLLAIIRCPQLSRSYARCKITIFPSRHIIGAKKVPHFSCFQKRHFCRFALPSGPKMPPERDSWRPESPIVLASGTSLGAPNNAEREGISCLQNATSAAGRDFGSFLRVCVWVCHSGRDGDDNCRWGPPTPTQHAKVSGNPSLPPK